MSSPSLSLTPDRTVEALPTDPLAYSSSTVLTVETTPLSVAVDEPRWARWTFAILAVALTVGYFLYTFQFWVPAHGGVDQNGYLLGAKNLLAHGTMKVAPDDPYVFIGRMWVTGHVPGTYYPKYPIGLPAIYAVARAIGGVPLVYLVNPIAMTLSLMAVFLLVRRLVGSFYGVLGLLVMATSPVTMGLTNNPNSHATAVCSVAWGMYLLIAWWQEPRAGRLAWARVIASGFLLGMSVTIRYTEGLLLLPVGIVILFVLWDEDTLGVRRFVTKAGTSETKTRRETLRPILQSLTLLAAWAVPVGALLLVNKAYFDSWTGYDPTHESTGFLWAHLVENWDTMLRQFYVMGLAFVFPIALIGLCLWFRQDVRVATVLAAWALPCVFIYTVYYWAPDSIAIGYSRFFLTVFPAIIAMAAVAMRALDSFTISPGRLLRIAGVCAVVGLAVGGVTAWKIKDGWGPTPGMLWGIGGGALLGATLFVRPSALLVIAGTTIAFMSSVLYIENDSRGQAGLQIAGEAVTKNVPNDAVIFSKDGLLHHLQFIGDWKCYSLDLFDQGTVNRLAEQSDDLDKTQPFQAERAKELYDLLKGEDNNKLAKRQNELMDAAIASGKRTFLIMPRAELVRQQARFAPPRLYQASIVSTWSEPPVNPNARNNLWLPSVRNNRPNMDRSQVWQIVEVTRKPSTIAPATQPKPATAPVAVKPPASPVKPSAPVAAAVVTPAKPVSSAPTTKPTMAPVAAPTSKPAATTKPAT